MSDIEANNTSEQDKMPDYLRTLERIIDISIGDPFLYMQALRHRSALQDADDLQDVDSYERLEFLGDAVLDLIVSRYLFEIYSDATEGFLTKLRSRIVRGDTLATFADEWQLGELMILGDRARKQEVQLSKSVLADVFEALIGALYIDQGYELTQDLVLAFIDQMVNLDELIGTMENYKSLLLEYAQSKGWDYPIYHTIKEEGPGHDKTFTIEVEINGEAKGQGRGKSKKKAEQAAARTALEVMGVNSMQ
jgi:ribonuclease-3